MNTSATPLDGRRPILVTGTHRSGSTWVGQMLALGRQLGPVHEPFNPANRWSWLESRPRQWFAYDDIVRPSKRTSAEAIDTDIKALADLSYPLRRQLHRISTPRHVGAVARDYAKSVLWRRQRRSLLMKDPIAFFLAPWLHQTYGIRPLILIRHPAAFASSLKRLNWHFDIDSWRNQPLLMSGPLARHVRDIDQMDKVGNDIVARSAYMWRIMNSIVLDDYVQTAGWIVVRYEDLASSPATSFRRLYRDLNLTFTDDVTERMHRLTEGTASGDKGSHMRVDRNSAAAMWTWQSRLSQREIERVRSITDDVASRLYEDDDWRGPTG